MEREQVAAVAAAALLGGATASSTVHARSTAICHGHAGGPSRPPQQCTDATCECALAREAPQLAQWLGAPSSAAASTATSSQYRGWDDPLHPVLADTTDPAGLLLGQLPQEGLAVTEAAVALVRHVYSITEQAMAIVGTGVEAAEGGGEGACRNGAGEEGAGSNTTSTAQQRRCLLLLATARDCLHLYLAVAPLTLREPPQGQGQPHSPLSLPMLHHNSCLYLARHAARLAQATARFLDQHPGMAKGPTSSSAGLPPLPPPPCPPFLDLLHPLMEAGQAALLSCLAGVRDRLKQQWEEQAPTLDSAAHKEGEARLRGAVAAQLATLGAAALAWCPILPHGHYCRCVGLLLDSLLERTVSAVLVLENIDDEAGTALAGVVQQQMGGAGWLDRQATLLAVAQAGAGTRTGTAAGAGAGAAVLCPSIPPAPVPATYVRHWARAGQLAAFLAASPSTMQEWARPGGELDTVGGLSRREAARLVRALVDKGPQQAKLLAQVAAGAGKLPPGL